MPQPGVLLYTSSTYYQGLGIDTKYSSLHQLPPFLLHANLLVLLLQLVLFDFDVGVCT